MGRRASEAGARVRAARLVLLGAAAAALQAAPAHALDYNWLGGDGNWNDANWDQAGFPSPSDNAAIDGIVALHVTATAGITNLTLGDTSFSDAALYIDQGVSFQAVGDGVVGAQFGSFGTLTVDGSLLTNNLTIGDDGEGWMIVNGGGAVTSVGPVTLGLQFDGYGAADVLSGGAWTLLSDLVVGSEGIADLFVDGGTVNAVNVTLGADQDGEGTIFLTNGGTLTATTLNIASDADAFGAVLIGGDFLPDAPGFLDVGAVNIGPGTGGIQFNHTSTGYDFDAAVSGGSADNLIFTAGVTNFTADSSGFTGFALVVDPSATLNVNGQLGGTIGVLGGRLGGSGAINDAFLGFDGVLAPGNSIGAMSAHHLDFGPDAIFEIETDAAGNADFVSATGLVAIDPDADVQVLPEPGAYALNTEYFILDAGAGDLSGAFGAVTSSSALLDPSLRYDYANGDIYLTLSRVLFDTPNQNAVAGALVEIGSGPLVDAPSGGADLDQMSGELFASVQGVALADTQGMFGLITERLSKFAEADRQVRYASLDEVLPIATGRNTNFWARAFGGWGELDGNANSAGLDYSRSGVMGGLDAAAGQRARVGASVAWFQGEADVDARRSSADTDVIDVSAYGSVSLGALNLAGALGHSWRALDTERRVDVGPLSETLRASYDARALHAEAELSSNVMTGEDSLVTTFFGLSHVALESDAFTERGGATALRVEEGDESVTSSRLGLRGWQRISNTGSVFGSIAWRHSFGDIAPHSRNAFVSSPGAVFDVAGAPLSEDGAAVNAGASFNLPSGVALTVSYRGDIGDGASEHAAGVRLTWVR